jgi:phosphoglycolate phosphatase-like HAD superfamily hydrolase
MWKARSLTASRKTFAAFRKRLRKPASLRKLGLTGHEAVMIGDTPYDAEAASGAGTAAAGVLTRRV